MNNEKMITETRTSGKSRKKLLLIILGAVLLLALVGGFLVWYNIFYEGVYQGDMYESKEEVYVYFDEEPHASLCYDMSEYDRRLENIRKGYMEDDAETANRVRSAVDLPDKFDEVIAEGNQMIIDYFNENYSVSVEGELGELRAVHCPLNDLSIGGVYYFEDEGVTDGNVIAIDSMLTAEYDDAVNDEEYYKYWKEDFYSVYIHETLHYLGSACEMTDQIDWMYLIEGITEALTENVMVEGGYSYKNTSTYVLNKKLAEQLMVADKDIIVLMIEGFDYITVEELDEYFDSRSIDGMGEAIEESVTLIMGHPKAKRYQRMAQHLMGEYLKYYELTDEQQIEIADNFIAPISKIEK